MQTTESGVPIFHRPGERELSRLLFCPSKIQRPRSFALTGPFAKVTTRPIANSLNHPCTGPLTHAFTNSKEPLQPRLRQPVHEPIPPPLYNVRFLRRTPVMVSPAQTTPQTSGAPGKREFASNGDVLIRIRGLTFRRGDRVILDQVDMDIPRGEVVAIMGPSGVGKTTILKLIAGQLQPDAGSIEIDGQNLAGLDHRGLYTLRENMGFLLQNGALFTDLTVFENVAAPLRAHRKLDESELARQVSERLDAVGLGGTEELMPDALSGGMARRVALARAVIMDPSIVMFDEPMAGLDPIAVSTINTLIRETNDRLGLTSIVVTHDVAQMMKLVDRCFIIADGRIAGEGAPADLRHSDNPSVDQFMNGKVDGPIPFHYDRARGAGRP